MSARFKPHLILIAFLLPVILWAETPRVVATITFIADMARQIAGNNIEVVSLMPIGADPHTYDAVPGDARLLANADLILRNGLFLEGWLNRLIENSGTNAAIVTVSEGVEVIYSEEYHGAADPHAWMNATNGIIYARNIRDALVSLDPANATSYSSNFAAYEKQLLALDEWIISRISQIPQQHRILITTHDAFSYYAQRYGLEVVSILGTSTDAEAQTSDINFLIRTVRENSLPAIFPEATINPKLIRQIAADLGIALGDELFADSLGDEESGADTYINMLMHNTSAIVEGLTGRRAVTFAEQEQLWFLAVVFLLFCATLVFIAWRLHSKSTSVTGNEPHSIEVKNLTVSYDRKTILTNINITIEPGRLYGLIGPNGAGKSTLFKAIMDLIPLDSGEVNINGLPVNKVRQKIAYIPQKDMVDWSFPATVKDIVMTGRYPLKKVTQRLSAHDSEIAEKAIEKLEISSIKNKQIGELSGGQQQRMFLARALAQEVMIYLMDEPFVGVDVVTEENMIGILKALAAEGKTIIVIHHDLSKIEEYFDSVIMVNQRLVAAGPTSTVFTPQNIKLTYSGQLTLLQKMEKYLY